MGQITWQKQINHIDRNVSAYRARRMGTQSMQRKAAFREARGLPSRSLSMDVVWMKLDLKMAKRMPDMYPLVNVEELGQKVMYAELRSRLLERKQMLRAKNRPPRILRSNTNIMIWKRRQEWLKLVERDQIRSANAFDEDL